ncbi:MAG TPA: oligosaccharide flippase family protein [Woeseiaceae bacterium]|nr:oligosaccharide flippase family protein [Woeseiaceae bacterium]
MTSDHARDMGSQVQRLALNAVALVAGGIVAQLVFTLLEVLVARKLGAEAYGVFVTAYSWSLLGSVLMGLGTAMWTIQEGSRDHARIPGLLGAGLAVNLLVFGALYGLLVLANFGFPPNPVLSLMLLILPYGLILALQTTLGSYYSCYETMHANAFFQGVAPVAVLVFYFVYSANGLSLPDVAYAYVAGAGLVTGIWVAWTLRQVRPRVSAGSIREVLKSSNQYALSNLLGMAYFRVDVIMISALAGIYEAGIYAAAFKLVELVSKVAVVAGRVFAPAIFKASHAPGKAYTVLVSMMTRFMAIAGLVAGVAAFILAEDLVLLLFGDKYAASVPILRILAGVMATRCMMVAMQLLMSSVDLHFQRVAALGTTVAAHVAANAVLIPMFGAEGAAWAALFSSTLLIFLYGFSSRGRQFDFQRWLLLPSVLAAIVAVAALLTEANALVSAVVSVSVFLAGLLATGFVRRDEIRFVLRAVRPNGLR